MIPVLGVPTFVVWCLIAVALSFVESVQRLIGNALFRHKDPTIIFGMLFVLFWPIIILGCYLWQFRKTK